ncbi:hypothetical protein ACFUCV_14670 [Specibacter sp. NPDC057265]|uniref:hypothetical protein n=1 Tax=Specibacter sp. NPDC057265 TaxID=3346075 RepID=UPI0036356869
MQTQLSGGIFARYFKKFTLALLLALTLALGTASLPVHASEGETGEVTILVEITPRWHCGDVESCHMEKLPLTGTQRTSWWILGCLAVASGTLIYVSATITGRKEPSTQKAKSQ